MAAKTPSNIGAIQPKTQQTAVAKTSKSVVDYLNGESFKNQLAMALPKFLDTDHFVRSAMSEFRLNAALQECSVPSVLGYYMQAAMMGLEPASVLGQCYPVPFWNGKTGQREVQFIMGYRGMLSLARRTSDVSHITAEVVHEKDEFELTYGMNEDIVHKPYTDGDAGVFKGAYVIVHFKNGAHQMKYMSKFEIDNHRKRSKAAGSRTSPWDTDYDEMAKKTVFRSLFKWLPISIEQALAVARDEGVVRLKTDTTNAVSVEDMIDTEFVVSTEDTVEPDQKQSPSNAPRIDESEQNLL